MKIKSVIYCIENIINGKKYVGSAVNYIKRCNNHKSALRLKTHTNIKLQRAWNKYGEGNLIFSILECVPNLDELVSREQYYIDTMKPWYNIAPCAHSMLGFKHTEESKNKISKNNAKIWKGKKLPEWVKERMRKPKSDETRLKLSEYASNRPSSHNAKLGDSIGNPVIQYDLNSLEPIQEFKSVLEASRITNTCDSSIRKVCSGYRNKAGGYFWKFKLVANQNPRNNPNT